jgi:hypothetical protein
MHMSFLLTGAEGGDIPAGVPMQELTPEAPEAAEGAPEPVAEIVEKTTGGRGGHHVARDCSGGGYPLP